MKGSPLKLILPILFLTLTTVLFAQSIEIPLYSQEDTVISYTGFTLSYIEEHEQAEWVAYELTKEEVAGNIGRTDDFRSSPHIESETASLNDYRGSGYDRGHLAPAGDFGWSEEAMSDTFYYSNMSPQKPGFNRGIWRSLESQVRDWAVRDESLYVVTGPVFQDDEDYVTIGENEVAIPHYYYKVLLDLQEPEIKAIGFLLPHESSSKHLSAFAIPVDEIEEVTGFDFFHELDDGLEESLEADVELEAWFDGEDYEVKASTFEVDNASEAPAKYWMNGNTRHNPSCRYYGETKNGYYTDEKEGVACGLCGG
ncbi:MAG: DNA/RNA non-specific endonuclease [Spirochaetia bacterium]|nr:DNA/RNA non-specific endonuclease [Spirochaetia bacterium]